MASLFILIHLEECFSSFANVPAQLVHPEFSKSSQKVLKVKALSVRFGSYLCLGAASDRNYSLYHLSKMLRKILFFFFFAVMLKEKGKNSRKSSQCCFFGKLIIKEIVRQSDNETQAASLPKKKKKRNNVRQQPEITEHSVTLFIYP